MSFEEIIWTALPMLAVGGLLAGIGRGIQEAIGDSQAKWAVAWHQTRALHAPVAGLALGFTSLPVPEQMGSSVAMRVVWYGLAGVLAVPIYEVWRAALARRAA